MPSSAHIKFLLMFSAAAAAGCGQQSPKFSSSACLAELPAPVTIKAARTTLGNDRAYPEERPLREVSIEAYTIDATEVTNAQFAAFVKDSGYVTDAEKPQPGFDVPGAAIFRAPSAAHPNWWQFSEGANWRHPDGLESSIEGRGNDPVVQVSFNDAKAYADWAGRRLPSEAEWEHAAKGGADTFYVWGEERAPGEREMANTWQGAFPLTNTENDGYHLRAPAGCFEANGYGLYDMIGNVWEWTDSVFQDSEGEAIYTIKGGSFLCAENYCRRYRASARQPQEAGLPTNHIGFRTVGD